jgi:hypothetical protein
MFRAVCFRWWCSGSFVPGRLLFGAVGDSCSGGVQLYPVIYDRHRPPAACSCVDVALSYNVCFYICMGVGVGVAVCVSVWLVMMFLWYRWSI